MDKSKISAVIRYTLPEIDHQINALENMTRLRIYGLESMDFMKPYEKLLKDMKKIRTDLMNKYDDAVADNNRTIEPILGEYKDNENL
jgi:hypothetical protein